jgi:hypothetical protein
MVITMKKDFKFSIILICLITFSCSIITTRPDKPPIEFNPEYLNQQIKLIAYTGLDPYKTNQNFVLHLEYDSENKIVFPSDYNQRMFLQQNGKWVEIKEKQVIRSKDQVVLSPATPLSYGQLVGFWPQIDDQTKVAFLRAYVFGDMTLPDGSTKPVTAFIDVILTP